MSKPNNKLQTDINAIKHNDKRVNIPTEELKDFLENEDITPRTILYPRDTSLDPQLVWKGKDEQDSKDLEVPAVPIYIQEKIHPQYLIEDLRAQANKGKPTQADFFSDFNGIKFDQMVEFYQHEQHWSNRMILGDSLLVMNSLAEKETMKGKVQMIYLDPPYGIKFGSNWQVSTRKRDVKDGNAEDATRQPEQIKAFRDTWELGIHSYLAYLRDRLVVARELLTETGSIFVQIGDENVHLVRCLMDEVFGSENFVNQIIFQISSGRVSEGLDSVYNVILWYAKNLEQIKSRKAYKTRTSEQIDKSYNFVEYNNQVLKLNHFETGNGEIRLPDGAKRFKASQIYSQTPNESSLFQYNFNGKNYVPSPGSGWRTSNEGLRTLELANRLMPQGQYLTFKLFNEDFPFIQLHNIWTETASSLGGAEKIYVVQTNLLVIQRCMLMTTDPGDLVLDPTCGSGTTAYVAEQWGRRWITCDTSRVALALARTRLMSARFPYYLLADSYEGVRKEMELTGQPQPAVEKTSDIRHGFVYKRVPHITLKSIANNPDIKEGLTRREIDEAIARHADTEILYDQPYEDNKRLRVTGPFTVESLSPHRMQDKSERPSAETQAQKEDSTNQFSTIILENLKEAGVQIRFKDERIKFTYLDQYAGEWIQARGEYVDKEGNNRTVAVAIGPEYGTVSSTFIKEAAKEAVKGVGFDVLLICGFAFEADVAEETKRFGNLNILITRMNPDLAMSNELLKKTKTGNLFTVFGEPDIKITKQPSGKVIVEIHGVDVYDPTTGQVRSNSTDDIACWFIDTDYNQESFFVRHAYFTGNDQPYEKLKKALKAEIDESAWADLYSTTSRPFDLPKTGKIAVKVINHYGDEVLKMYEVK
ncbi:site-specific DNA-methyltransferase [Dehalococcoides mccartyi]|uniref:site-specific DNA-methyltransferase n=1 Tax=Dehalococcoides mccartyi TaxID=61435 RepID=UPI0008058ABE|nr:site-specific DNA-methyltransferase [Dehalococcoides mccartyi]OBW61578.1 MAG: DNA methylase [Dehalococcoides mccartyi]